MLQECVASHTFFPLFTDRFRSLDINIVNMVANPEKSVEEHELHEEENEQDVEKAFLEHEPAEHDSEAYPQKTAPPGLSRKFWVFAAINTLSTAGIVSLLVAHSDIKVHH